MWANNLHNCKYFIHSELFLIWFIIEWEKFVNYFNELAPIVIDCGCVFFIENQSIYFYFYFILSKVVHALCMPHDTYAVLYVQTHHTTYDRMYYPIESET